MLILADAETYLENIADREVHSVITDIPYNEVSRKTGGLRTIEKGQADRAPVNLPKLAEQWVRISRGHIIVWCGMRQVSPLVELFEDKWNLTVRVGTWTKSNPSPMNAKKMYLSAKELCVIARHKKADFLGFMEKAEWYGPSVRVKGLNGERVPTPKPIWLMRKQIETVVPVGELVLDSHMGSGSTGVACKTDYQFIGIDNDPDCVRLAEHRIKMGK
jgi:site-specific DNA-methyltransferase (adenine-specific)